MYAVFCFAMLQNFLLLMTLTTWSWHRSTETLSTIIPCVLFHLPTLPKGRLVLFVCMVSLYFLIHTFMIFMYVLLGQRWIIKSFNKIFVSIIDGLFRSAFLENFLLFGAAT